MSYDSIYHNTGIRTAVAVVVVVVCVYGDRRVRVNRDTAVVQGDYRYHHIA